MQKKALTMTLALAICLGLFTSWGAALAYQSGAVTEIATAQELRALILRVREEPSIDVRLVADIDLSGQKDWEGIGWAWNSGGYSGTFDGNGHTITGLTGGSLFGTVAREGVIRDLTLTDVDIVGRAPLVAQSFGRVENCHADGRVKSPDLSYTGGLVGRVESGAVINCSADVDLIVSCTEEGATDFGAFQIGGMTAYLAGLMDNCTYTGSITVTGTVPSCGAYVGGLAGFVNYGDSELRNSSSRGDITLDVLPSSIKESGVVRAGGICGVVNSSTKVRNCCHIGAVSVSMPDDEVYAGGIDGSYQPGYSYSNKFENCWCTGAVTIRANTPQANFSERESLPLYFVGENAQVGSPAGQRLAQTSLTDGTLLERLNAYVAAQGNGDLNLWVQTAQGPLPQGKAAYTPFADVKLTDYFCESVLWAVEEGVTTGTSATTFSPDVLCSRGQILTFLWRAAGQPAPVGGENPFNNSLITPDKFYYEPMLWAYQRNIVSDPGMNPDQPCTRLEAVCYIWSAAGCPDAGAPAPFADIDDPFFANVVAWAVEEGVTTGTSADTFSPDDTCTRAQIVTFLYRYFSRMT